MVRFMGDEEGFLLFVWLEEDGKAYLFLCDDKLLFGVKRKRIF